MSLDNIQFPPFVIQELFKNSLVTNSSGKSTAGSLKKAALNYLGNNRKNIVLVVSNEETLHLPDDQLNFLLGILAACKLSMEDVAILNINKNETATYLTVTKELNAEKIFLFGVTTEQVALPLQIPDYQVQPYNNQVYLCAPDLATLQHDKAEKTKLWTSLKKIFSL